MKFNKPSEKHPPFKTELALILSDDSWKSGFLDSILIRAEGKEFKFVNLLGNEIENVIYWTIPKSPVKK